ncbi:MAG: FtsH protease activity modulator HflK [Desulfobacterales bacterium]|jgi:modulator of FtsH protease HflK|nr:FtsH protease activity modulator HflK [Desulfobacteraceae bacterium]MBT7085063.1 FtsH protease activity modulator HflK [Desulfobacterales bacterium]MBT7698623.1 FtsH protease activity modulator HflK [Desulfobacterales bacterium]
MAWDWEKLQENQKKSKKTQGSDGIGPPDLEELGNKIKNIKFPGGPFILSILIVLGYLGYSMVYQVKLREVGMIQQFGKFVRKTHPGLHLKWPNGIEKLTIVNVDGTRRTEFGVTTGRTDRRMTGGEVTYRRGMEAALMLTGDLNVAIVPWIVQYKIKDPEKFLFRVYDAEGLLRDLSEAAMRLVVGDRSVNEVINEREEIATQCREVLQKELDNSETGIRLVNLELKKTNVPTKVQPSFNAVNKAEQEKETMILTAKKDYNQAIPAAKGEAERTIRAAEGYSLDRINRAEGEASKFTALYNEYAKAKDVTKRRLYLEMFIDVFPKIGQKYLIDSSQKNFLPLLNIESKKGVTK